jgi:hypothetical protein
MKFEFAIFFVIALSCSVHAKKKVRVPVSGIAVLSFSDKVKGSEWIILFSKFILKL